MADVGAAATTEDADLWIGRVERCQLMSEFARIAVIQLGAVVQLFVAEPRCICTDPTDTLQALRSAGEHRGKVIGVRTVDHEVGSGGIGLAVDRLDGFSQTHARWQPTIGLDGERHHGRHTLLGCGSHEADGLSNVGQREGGEQIDATPASTSTCGR